MFRPNANRIGKARRWRIDLSHATRLPRTVVLLGIVSFFTDFSSEMIYPLLPLFLATVLGAGAVAIGFVEGLAESTASFVKILAGYWTDRTNRRKPLVFAGYSLAGAVRPLIGLAPGWTFVAAFRFLDRVGKGLRTSPRDALIADVTDPQTRGGAYGFHRSLDHAGAVTGPLAAAALLRFFGLPLRTVFLLAAVPAAVVVLVLWLAVHEPDRSSASMREDRPEPVGSGISPDLRLFLFALLLFTLANSSDAFLLLKLSNAGLGAASVALLWSAHHVIKMLSNYVAGNLGDRVGYRLLIIAGWLYYALIYLGFAWFDSRRWLVALFLAYGLYYGLTEPAERAWVSVLAPPRARGRFFGYYHAIIGFAALPSSLLFGFLWKNWGSPAAFVLGSVFAVVAAGMLVAANRRKGTGA
jgi:MFS family permease